MSTKRFRCLFSLRASFDPLYLAIDRLDICVLRVRVDVPIFRRWRGSREAGLAPKGGAMTCNHEMCFTGRQPQRGKRQ